MNKKGIWALYGPLGGREAFPLGLGAKGGPSSHFAGASPSLVGLVPHGKGRGCAPLLGLYKEG